MTLVLTADWHLTDNPADEYRWTIFDELKRQKPEKIYMLGDLTDRKDRHSAELVNRLIAELRSLAKVAPVTILLGNHDLPLKGTPFWSFLNQIDWLQFITEPTAEGNLLMLPYVADPKTAWRGIDFSLYRCAFIHQTVTGAVTDGHRLENKRMPLFPRGLIVYSGDIHTPQQVNSVTYVGAPHPIKFGDSYDCRLLEVSQDWKLIREIPLHPLRKVVASVSGIDNLDDINVRRGDRLRLSVRIGPEDVVGWAAQQAAYRTWAVERGVELNLLEAIVETTSPGQPIMPAGVQLDPKEVLRAFGKGQGLDSTHIDFGLRLLEEAVG